MCRHAKALGNGLEVLLFFVDAVAGAPPPRLMHKRPVCRGHQPDNAVVHVAGQLRRQMRSAVPVAEGWQLGRRWQRLPGLQADPSAARPGHVDPGVSIPLLAGKCGRVDAPGIGILAGQRWNLHALPGFRLEDPAMILAGDRAAVEPSAGERNAAMGTTVAHGEDAAVLFAAQHQRDPQKHGGGHLLPAESAATHGRVPVVVDEGRIRSQQIAGRKNRRSSSRCCAKCHGSPSRSPCPYYSVTGRGFIIAEPLYWAAKEIECGYHPRVVTELQAVPTGRTGIGDTGSSRFTHRSRKIILTLAGLWLLLYASFTLFTPPLLDDADSVHAEVAREMVARHDWVTLYANGVRYLEKAPLMYWSMAASFTLFGPQDWAARLPLALATLAVLLVVYATGRRLFASDTAGFYAALILLTSFGIFIYTRIIIPDVIVCLWLSLAMLM